MELLRSYEEGDITADDLASKLDGLDTERDELVGQIKKFEGAVEAAAEAATARWYSEVDAFMAAHPEVKGSELKLQAFDQYLRQVTGNPANNSMSNGELIEKAYTTWVDQVGYVAPAAPAHAPTPAAATSTSKAKAATPPPKRDIPPTLAHVPAAAVAETDDGKYAALDRLMDSNPLAYEERLSAMSEHEREAYMASR